jgi:hypothetical protein
VGAVILKGEAYDRRSNHASPRLEAQHQCAILTNIGQRQQARL